MEGSGDKDEEVVDVIELTGRHHTIPFSVSRTTLDDFVDKVAAATQIPRHRVILVHSGAKIPLPHYEDPAEQNQKKKKKKSETRDGGGGEGLFRSYLDPMSISPHRCHVVVSFELPLHLRDGKVHPFSLNGTLLGGDLVPEVPEDVTLETFRKMASELPEVESGNPVPEEDGEPDDEEVIPECVTSFLRLADVDDLCRRLPFSPMVCRNWKWTEAFRKINLAKTIENDENEVEEIELEKWRGICFLMDQQLCCRWYAMWKHHENDENDELNLYPTKIEVYVAMGDESNVQNASYLTSASFHKFLCELAWIQKQEWNKLNEKN